jgi:predicted esterase
VRGLLVVVALLAAPLGATAGAGALAANTASACPPASSTLLVALHGYGSSPEALAAASGLDGALFPAGSGDPARWALPGRLPGGDDLGRVSALIDRCRTPGGRVVLAGFSNGAAFAGELACRLGDDVDAVVLVGGAGLAPSCGRVWEVVVHGAADDVVPVGGGPVLGGTLQARPLAEVAADRVVVVPGWGHTWPAEATAEVLALL